MKRKTTILTTSILVFLTALGITLYPIISNYVNQKYASKIYTEYEEMIQNVDDTSLKDARRLAEQYNNALAPVSAYEQESLSEASQNYDTLLNMGGNGIMGYVEIPSIQVNLPIYHGTDSETLERGIGHLLGSSLPIGGGQYTFRLVRAFRPCWAENVHRFTSGKGGRSFLSPRSWRNPGVPGRLAKYGTPV